jgi:hypothetical protein
MVDLENISRVWRVSHQYRSMIFKYLRRCASLTITSLRMDAPKHVKRMLALLSFPMHLRHLRVDRIESLTFVYIIGVIGRNCRTLTSFSLGSASDSYNALYLMLSGCPLLTKLILPVPLASTSTTLMIADACTRLQIVPSIEMSASELLLTSSTYICPNCLLWNLSFICEMVGYLGWPLRELKLVHFHPSIICNLEYLPSITTLTSLTVEIISLEGLKSLVAVIPLMTSLQQLTVDPTPSNDQVPEMSTIKLCLPPSVRRLTFTHISLPTIVADELTALSIHRHAMSVVDMMQQFPNLDEVQYQIDLYKGSFTFEPSQAITKLRALPIPTVQWKTLSIPLDYADLHIISNMASLTSLQLSNVAFPSEISFINFLEKLPSTLIHIDLQHIDTSYDTIYDDNDNDSISQTATTPPPITIVGNGMIKLERCRTLKVLDLSQHLMDRLVLPNLNTFILACPSQDLDAFDDDVDEDDSSSPPPPLNLNRLLFINAPLLRKVEIDCPFTITPSQAVISSSPSSSLDCKLNITSPTSLPSRSSLSLHSLTMSLPLEDHMVTSLLRLLCHTLESLHIRKSVGHKVNSLVLAEMLSTLSSLRSLTLTNFNNTDAISLIENMKWLSHVHIITRAEESSRAIFIQSLPYLADIDFELDQLHSDLYADSLIGE